MESVYYLILGLCLLATIANWRLGVLLCILMDVIRDPVRKLSDGQSVMVTATAGVLWVGVFLGLAASQGRELRAAFRRYPALKRGILCLVGAIIPGALLALFMYRSGYVLAAIGTVSYLAPLIGLAIGWAYPRYEKDITRLLAIYVAVNAVAMAGTVLEWRGYEFPGLGGIGVEWIRHHASLQLKLIAGIYRSPDIMGLHAAHIAIFSTILAMRAKPLGRVTWTSLAVWGMTCVLLSGRRKMIGIPLIFLAAFLLLNILRGSKHASRPMIAGIVLSIAAGVALFSVREVSTSNDYQEYATTLLTRGVERSNELITGSVISTLQQSGVFGSGLGSATQGTYYTGIRIRKNWQEDGISRLFKELGVPGVVLIGLSTWSVILVVRTAIRLIPPDESSQQLQLALLAVVMGNAASFTASHQQYSGDPMNGLLVLFLLGCVLGCPRIYFQRLQRGRAALAGQSQMAETAKTAVGTGG